MPLETGSQGSLLPESPGLDPGWGHNHSARWSWVLRSAGRSTGTQCVLLWSLSPQVAGHVYLQQTLDTLIVNTSLCHTTCVFDHLTKTKAKYRNVMNTDSVLRWCWSAPWPLTSVCCPLGYAAMSCWLCQPALQNPLFPQGTGLAHLRKGKTRLSERVFSHSYCGSEDNYSPKSLLTLFFCRWPIKCHLISGHAFKIWMRKGKNCKKKKKSQNRVWEIILSTL